MEPDSSLPPEKYPLPEEITEPWPTRNPEQHWVKGYKLDPDLGKRFFSKVQENASKVLELSLQWEEYDKEMEKKESFLQKQFQEVKKKEEAVIERESKTEESFVERFLEANVMMLVLEKHGEEVVSQLAVKKKMLVKKHEKAMTEIDARKKEISLFDEKVKERWEELERKEGSFQVKLKEVATEIQEKKKFLELKEKELALKQVELEEERSKLEEASKRLRVEFGDASCLNHRGGKRKSEEAKEVIWIGEDPELFNCPDPDFNDFNNTMSSFAVGQVWALYDPLDDMPRYYAQIRSISIPQRNMQVTWLESVETAIPMPIACGGYKLGDSETQSLPMFSHQMSCVVRGKHVSINPRKGETWALFRDWTKTWNSHKGQQQKPPYRYDFVEVLSEFDRDQGIEVAYLGRVEGFTLVYKAAEQHRLIKVMIASDEMVRFSHRVPSFKLSGDEKEGVPRGSFELDPAAIPRDCLKAAKSKKKKRRLGAQ